jgi:hypothetical protein
MNRLHLDACPRTAIAIVVAAILLLGGCVALEPRFRAGFSSTDPRLFSAPPVVTHRGDEYLLVWTQASYPFFFEPNYKPMAGRLVFALNVTASSGNLAGRKREMKIEGAENLHALQRGGAYWWESEPQPDGRLVQLKIVEQPVSTAPR